MDESGHIKVLDLRFDIKDFQDAKLRPRAAHIIRTGMRWAMWQKLSTLTRHEIHEGHSRIFGSSYQAGKELATEPTVYAYRIPHWCYNGPLGTMELSCEK